MRRFAVGLFTLVLAAPALPAEPMQEIRALIARVAASDCRFYRNGEWHDAEAAADHLASKLRVARWLGRTGSAEDFIAQAGSQSSISGEPYRVRCGSDEARPSAGWLRELLRAVRATHDEAPATE